MQHPRIGHDHAKRPVTFREIRTSRWRAAVRLAVAVTRERRPGIGDFLLGSVAEHAGAWRERPHRRSAGGGAWVKHGRLVDIYGGRVLKAHCESANSCRRAQRYISGRC